MDSRKCSAALGFALLIGCVIGIVILIHNSGSSRKSSESSSSSSSVLHDPQHRHRPPPTTIVGGKAGSASDHFGSSPKDGFANDPNYRSSQPTMQEVNELADELHRILSPKSKRVHGTGGNGKGNPVNTGTVTSVRKTNGSLVSSSATSSAKASITAVNYSSVPKKSLSGSPPASMGSMTPVPALPTPVTPSISPNSSLPNRNHPLTSSSVNSEQEVALTNYHQKQQHNHHNSKPYSGHQSPPYFSPLPSLITTQMMAGSAERQAFAPHEMKGRGGSSGGGGGGGSLVHNDLYTTSWHPSIASPAGGGMAAPNHPYHHLRNHPQSHRPHNNNPQPPRPSSPAKINSVGKGAGYPLNQNHNRAPIPTQYQHGYHHYRHDHEKVEIDEDEDGDFVEVDDDDEDDVSGNPGNVKKEEEWGDDNDIADENEEDEEEDEEEEDEEDNGANPGFLMEPKNFAADLETLFTVANHLYTSPASLLSAFSTQAKTNSTKKADTDTPTFGLPTAFQGFLKVINETIQRSNNSKLLVELNEKYQGREARMSSNSKTNSNNGDNTNKSSSAVGTTSSTSDVKKNGEDDKQQSPYEKSLASFVFMSFGVFLLNQIHSFVQKTAEEHLKHHKLMGNESVGEGRELPWEENGPFTWYSPKSEMIMTTESSSLDILFQSPVSPNVSAVIPGNSPSSVSGRSNDDQPTFDGEGIMSGEGHVNNMFRALLNIANAYTKDSPAVECIWSLYCKDLDQTAHKEGLYGVAARINSVGLRLIMKQIPPALTFDVILRSLVGWDGLPCRKMFPECSVGNGTISMVSADESGGVKRVATNAL